MARLAGVLSDRVAPSRGPIVETMLARFAGEGGSAVLVGGGASLGWRGRGVPGLAEREGLLVALDGCIYNRSELGSTGSDAELVAELSRRHGLEGALSRLNGDFAVAVYDATDDTLSLGRDRFGVKPLYYVQTPGLVAFSSQPGPLLDLPDVRAEPSRQFVALFAASHYRYFDNDPERSPYEDVAQVPGAHVVRLRDGSATASRYWSLEDAPELGEAEGKLAADYRDLLLDAVSIRLAAAHRPAFTLSGGMDSSSVLGCAARAAGRKQQAFSAVYADRTYDESDDIEPMLGAAVERWHPVPVGSPDVLELVRRMVAVHDEPVATATWLSHFLVCEAAAQEGFDGLFGGLGGDELNAGEYEYFLYHFADLRSAGREQELTSEIERWISHHDHPIFRKSRAVVEDGLTRLVDLEHPGRTLPDRRRLERYAGALDPEFFDLDAFVPVLESPFSSYLKSRAYQDLFWETLPCCLRAEDRQAAAFGQERFLPFLDHRLAELMFRVPGALKIRDGITKRLLRDAMRGIVPDETRLRVKKTGWNAPAHVWFSDGGREEVLDLVRSQSFRERGIYDVAEVERLVNEHAEIVASGEPRENHMMFIWQLVNLETWLQSVDRMRVAV